MTEIFLLGLGVGLCTGMLAGALLVMSREKRYRR